MEEKLRVSRVGRKPIEIPDGVKVNLNDKHIKVVGKLGELSLDVHEKVNVEVVDGSVQVAVEGDHRFVRSLHGLTRALISNMITGVSQGFEKKLALVGVGYKATLQNRDLVLDVGKSHSVIMPLPVGIDAEVTKKQNEITLRCIDKAKLGQFTADVIRQRPPEPYKGKGIRYADQVIKLKAGKKAGK